MKYVPACLAIFLLTFCGGLASRSFFETFLRDDLGRQSQRVLLEAGVEPSDYQGYHFFVALSAQPESIESEAPVVLEHIEGQVWGANSEIPGPETPKESPASFSVGVQTDDTVVLEGTVASEFTKILLEESARSAVGVDEVINRISVNESTYDLDWIAPFSRYLTNFLSYSGVTRLSVEEGSLKIEGTVLSREVREKLGAQAIEIIPPPGVISNLLSVRKPKSPVFTIRLTGEHLEMSGLMPDDASGRQLFSHLRDEFAQLEFVDRFEVCDEVAEVQWLTEAKQLAPIFVREIAESGFLEIGKYGVVLSGEVESGDSIETLQLAAGEFEERSRLSTRIDLSVLPEREPSFELYFDKTGSLQIRGEVASSQFKDELLGALMTNFPDMVVHDHLVISDEVRRGKWGNATALAVDVVKSVENARVGFNPSKIFLAGVVPSEARIDELVRMASSLVEEGSVENQLDVAPPGPEWIEVDFSQSAIYFDSGSTHVDDSQEDNLARNRELIELLMPEEEILVVGYTDHRGDPSVNQRIGLNRARSVRDRLASLGIDADRMKIQHVGEDVSNVKDEELWKSRRVEIARLEEPPNKNKS